MSVSQINLWTCDICGAHCATAEHTYAWHDPTVLTPEGWTSNFKVPSEHRARPTDDICDACPSCQLNPDWSKYREAR